MAFVVTLREFTPPSRHDGLPWTGARIQESANGTSGWAQIDAFTFIDVDDNPASPRARTFTTENAAIENGWYRIQWIDATGDTMLSDAVQNAPLPTWAPSIQDVAARVRARTKDSAGNEIGTFTAETRPTAEQVEALIADAADKIMLTVGSTPNANVARDARRLSTLLAAMWVELSYFPEQIDRGMSPFNAMERMFKANLAELVAILRPDDGGSGGPGIPPGAPVLMPSYAYPVDGGGLVGWDTEF